MMPYWLRFVTAPLERVVTGQISDWHSIATGLHLILSRAEDLADANGEFFSQVGSPRGTVGGWPLRALDLKVLNPQAVDATLADRLWRRSTAWTDEAATEPLPNAVER